MRSLILIPVLSAALLASTLQADTMVMGDGAVDTRRLKSYEFTWIQCALQDGTWINMPELTESIIFSDEHTLLLRQKSTRPDGGTSKVEMTFEAPSFAPRSLKTHHTSGDGGVLAASRFEFTSQGYSGEHTQGGETQEVSGAVSSTQFAGTTMGLPLATLPWQDEPLEFSASMVSFDGTYDVTATWVSKETLDTPGGTSFVAYQVDVKWHHRESGDIYPPGPEATGGRYWLVPEPPEGIPYVLRYKTGAYAVEFLSEFCPK